MSLGNAITAALPGLQSEAESMMTDTCTITRTSGEPTFNGVTGAVTPAAPATVYAGKCRVRTRGKFLRFGSAEAGDADKVSWPYVVAIPAGTTVAPAVDDLVTITASSNAALVGAAMRVRIAGLETDSTARRMDCEEVVA